MASKSSPSRRKVGTRRPIAELAEAGSDDLPHYHGHRQRLRERFLNGGRDALPDYELLELLLFMAIPRVDTKPIAKSLIDDLGSFADVIAAPVEVLRQRGVSENTQANRRDCIFDVQQMGRVAFSDTCPMPFMGARATLTISQDGTWAPQLYKQGDDGTVLFQGGTLHGFAEAFRKTTFGNLVTRDAQYGEITWTKIRFPMPVAISPLRTRNGR